MSTVGTREYKPGKFIEYSSLTERPAAGTFGIGICMAGGTLYESDGASWTAISESSTASFTAGSIFFAGSSGEIAQDNASLFFDDTNNRLGLITTVPSTTVGIGGGAARTVAMERHTTADTAGNALTIGAGGATSGATDKAGGDLILQPGLSTGSAESGVQIKGVAAGGAGTSDGTQAVMIRVLGNKIGLFGVTPVVRPTALTTQLTTITHTAPGTPDYALQNLTNTGGFGFVSADEGNTVLSVIANLQARVAELETKLQGLGALT